MSATIASALAPAKVNLGLDIIGRRTDGYHRICTVMQAITLFDRLDLLYPGNGKLLPGNEQSYFENNVVERAARRLSERLSRPLDVNFRLTKRIPVAAGLGGGSSDAAAAMLLLARHWSIPRSNPLLAEVALETGSDVPFFLASGRALVEGRGEIIRQLPPMNPIWFVIIDPGLEIPTKTSTLYARLNESDFRNGELIRSAAEHYNLEPAALRNAFSRPLFDDFPSLAELALQIERVSGRTCYLSGAGPALYLVADHLGEAIHLMDVLCHNRNVRLRRIHIARAMAGAMAILHTGNVAPSTGVTGSDISRSPIQEHLR